MPNPHPATMPIDDLLKQCTLRRGRRSGPGGQHRNKVETRIVIAHRATGVTAEAGERRSQEQNRRAAVQRLRLNLALAVRSEVEPAGVPSDLWRSRCASGRMTASSSHEDFPALLAEALDVLHHTRADVKAAAEMLGCTTSQLVKFLKTESRALAQVNDNREELGLHKIR